jgi:hypothetical protein
VEALAAGIDALGREGEEEVLPDLPALALRLGEARQHDLDGRAGIGRALEDDELARLQPLLDLQRRVHDVGDVGVAALVERRRDADDHRVRLLQRVEVGGREELLALELLRELRARDVVDVALALRERVDALRVDVEADDLEPFLGEGEAERQSHVAEAEHGHGRVLLRDPVEQLLVRHRRLRLTSGPSDPIGPTRPRPSVGVRNRAA